MNIERDSTIQKETIGQQKRLPNGSHKGFLSPFRYPGGKSWLFKIVREWLRHQIPPPIVLVEPFAGGASTSLAAVNENLVSLAVFAEIDTNVAATWKTILNGGAKWLSDEVKSFRISRKKVKTVLARKPQTRRSRAFHCLLRNRTARGGVLAEGAGLIRKGEDGKGLSSRWYPKTLAKRIGIISSLKSKLEFSKSDGFKLIRKYIRRKEAVFFVDPPYTKAACRLYRHWKLNHEELFALLATPLRTTPTSMVR